jgi:hypothetical protein
MKLDKTVYLADPTHAQKADWNAKGYRVRPAELAPEGYALPPVDETGRKPRKPKSDVPAEQTDELPADVPQEGGAQ